MMKEMVSRTAIFIASSRFGLRPMTIQWVAVSARRPGELHVLAHDELERAAKPGLDGGQVNFTVSLGGMCIAH